MEGSVKFENNTEDKAKLALDEAKELMESSGRGSFNVPPGDALMAVIAGELKKLNANLEQLANIVENTASEVLNGEKAVRVRPI